MELHEFGYYMMQELLGPTNRDVLPFLSDVVRTACTDPGSQWDNPRWNDEDPSFNLIVVKTSVENGIPIDMLPLLDFYPIFAISDNLNDLGKLACSFLGFSAIVKRQMGNSIGTANVLENDPKLPLKMFIYRDLEGARQEEKIFEIIRISMQMRAGQMRRCHNRHISPATWQNISGSGNSWAATKNT